MSEMETADPSRKRGLFAIVTGRATASSQTGRGECDTRTSPSVVSFDRSELRVIFNLYGAKVASGEWRDYAIDFTPAKAVFSVFRRTSEAPLYRIEKTPDLAKRQGAYSVISLNGLVLRRGHDLGRVLGAIDRKLKLVGVEN
jgi:Protein of unknown function (DUF2794)